MILHNTAVAIVLIVVLLLYSTMRKPPLKKIPDDVVASQGRTRRPAITALVPHKEEVPLLMDFMIIFRGGLRIVLYSNSTLVL